jgi:hypothetical protein
MIGVIESNLKKYLGRHNACQIALVRGSFLVDPLQRCAEARLPQT